MLAPVRQRSALTPTIWLKSTGLEGSLQSLDGLVGVVERNTEPVWTVGRQTALLPVVYGARLFHSSNILPRTDLAEYRFICDAIPLDVRRASIIGCYQLLTGQLVVISNT